MKDHELMQTYHIPPGVLEAIREVCGFNPNKGPKACRKMPERALIVAIARKILDSLGTRVTVRQLYYQLVSHNIISNNRNAYTNMGKILVIARDAGVMPWDAFEDRSRFFMESKPHVEELDPDNPENPAEIFKDRLMMEFYDGVAKLYGFSKWINQPHYVEVWVEKDALSSFVNEVCGPWEVPVVVSRGYVSVTFREQAKLRFAAADGDGVILYFGDFDSSGMDITRNIEEGMAGYAEVKRVALTSNDITQYSLPPNPIKDTDPRAAKFRAMFGEGSYELDALHPSVLKDRVRTVIESHWDWDLGERMAQKERHWRANYTDLQNEMRTLLEKSDLYKKLLKR